ncbi:acyl-homoserine-lactone synthase [Roseobacter sp. GAI101]|uniref:acyl-homoserine-lactone synthase n=1 Tax=Roseobacter sp. (strain GAI101) TaxID=391589 RepID=UPI000187188D|nr:acyl-homoserine-lactone synthase [Roseobacter sp. GAI101]EEB83951.1 conserved hypothetical protein [Roseobacter sp. GAI101]
MNIQRNFVTNRRWMSIFPELVPQEELDPVKLEAHLKLRKPTKKAEPKTPASIGRNLHVSTLSISNLHNHGELFVNFLRARKKVFINQAGWDLSEVDGMEFDQYDTPRARWIVLHEFGEVLGGVRLTPTTSQCGHYSYMIRDAQLGVIDTIPADVLFFQAPVTPSIWEATRLFISSDTPAARRADLQRLLLEEMADTAAEMGAEHVIGIVPAVFSKWMTRLGLLSAVQVGPVMNIDGTRTQAALMRVDG